MINLDTTLRSILTQLDFDPDHYIFVYDVKNQDLFTLKLPSSIWGNTQLTWDALFRTSGIGIYEDPAFNNHGNNTYASVVKGTATGDTYLYLMESDGIQRPLYNTSLSDYNIPGKVYLIDLVGTVVMPK